MNINFQGKSQHFWIRHFFSLTKTAFTENQLYQHLTHFVKMGHIWFIYYNSMTLYVSPVVPWTPGLSGRKSSAASLSTVAQRTAYRHTCKHSCKKQTHLSTHMKETNTHVDTYVRNKHTCKHSCKKQTHL